MNIQAALYDLLSKHESRLKQLLIEVVMGNYYDGWSLNGIKNEILILEEQIIKIKKDLKIW